MGALDVGPQGPHVQVHFVGQAEAWDQSQLAAYQTSLAHLAVFVKAQGLLAEDRIEFGNPKLRLHLPLDAWAIARLRAIVSDPQMPRIDRLTMADYDNEADPAIVITLAAALYQMMKGSKQSWQATHIEVEPPLGQR